ncbi:glycosyltransferase family 2 protein [Desemzia sp. FAM 23991]|uniref:glycosyltransferase family 2 protein n=1 Tax=unclassified Desemzia TaxID=2685243 RepID=UPI00388A940A
MNEPLISVIVPTFDRPIFLRRAIESVIKQDYKNIEIVVVVDGFSNGTAEYIEQAKKTSNIKIKLVQTNIKVGGSEARNIGVKLADGELIALLDDDDEWFTDKLSSQIKLINKNHLSLNDDFLCFTSLERYKNKNQKKYDKLPNVNYKESGKTTIASYLFEIKGLKNIGFIQTSTVLVPKHIIIETPFTKGLIKHQDWDWLLKVDNNHQLTIVQVEDPKIIYHSDVPKDTRVGYVNRWKFTEEWLEKHKAFFTKLAYESFILNYILLGIASDEKISKEQRKVEIKKRYQNLSLATKLRPYTLKIIIYMMLNKY